jgi:hypothetical protein
MKTLTPELPVAVVSPAPLTVSRPAPTVGEMLGAVIEKGITAENVTAIKKLVGLYERMQDKEAEKAFAAAFVGLQAEMPAIKAVKPVPNKDGSVRYRYAPYEEIMEQVAPLLKKHGFTLTFSTEYVELRLVKTCTLQHVGGHKASNSFAVRVGSGPPCSTETQADGAAATYAKRAALCDCLNIVIEHDNDARAEGSPITDEQAEELQRRVIETESNEVAFLKFCGVKPEGNPTLADYRKIGSTHYSAADEMLAKKEARGR